MNIETTDQYLECVELLGNLSRILLICKENEALPERVRLYVGMTIKAVMTGLKEEIQLWEDKDHAKTN